jgi:hypothetical protein
MLFFFTSAPSSSLVCPRLPYSALSLPSPCVAVNACLCKLMGEGLESVELSVGFLHCNLVPYVLKKS